MTRFYEIRVERKNGQALRLSWELKDAQGLEKRFSGRYRLRSSRTDLSDMELWKLYNMLTQVEASFGSLEQELFLRPSTTVSRRGFRGMFSSPFLPTISCASSKGRFMQPVSIVTGVPANASKRPSACENHHGRPQGAGHPHSIDIRARSGSAGNSRCSRSGAPAPKEARKHRVKNL